MQFAKRLQPLQANVFADMDRAKANARASGKTILDLSLGSSDLPVAEPILDTIATSLRDRSTHGYLLFHGTQDFREAAARWYESRYQVAIDPHREVLPLIGSQEGTAHFPLAILDPGDFALLLDPGYPSHAGGVYLAGGQIYTLPLLAENNFLPVFADIPTAILAQAKLLVLSYPHNPTAAIAPLSFFQEAVAFCCQHDLVLVHDFPYADFVFAPHALPPSALQADPQKERTLEFFTFSKSYNMGGFRIGFAVGNRELIAALARIKAVVDFNQYRGILKGAIAALESQQETVRQTVEIFQKRRDCLVGELHRLGWPVPVPPATLYLWAKLPKPWAQDSINFCTKLVEATGVALSPGAGFGKAGEGYVRFALVHESEVLVTAAHKIAAFVNVP